MKTDCMITDITGSIRDGIWCYGGGYPCLFVEHIKKDVCYEIFHGMNSQTGTYLETTAHVNGYEGNCLLEDTDVKDLVDIPCKVLHLINTQKKITAVDIKNAIGNTPIKEGSAILLDSGWDDWYSPNFVQNSTYLSRDAMEYLLSFKPYLLGSDTPSWQKDEVVFDLFSKTDTLLLASLINLNIIVEEEVTLTVLPIRMEGTCCAPARAIIKH